MPTTKATTTRIVFTEMANECHTVESALRIKHIGDMLADCYQLAYDLGIKFDDESSHAEG